MQLIEQGMITSQHDLVKLEIIDWNRLNGTSSHMADAMRDISSWLIGRTAYTIVERDLSRALTRDDFPMWKHEGSAHRDLARLFWNDFHHYHPLGELLLADEPDFYGTLKHDAPSPDMKEDREMFSCNDMGYAHFWGDIGQVSAFALTVIRKMEKGDIWMSILNEKQQVIIEALEDLGRLFEEQVIRPILGPRSPRKTELLRQVRRR